MGLLQREHHEIVAGIGVGYGKMALGVRITLYRALYIYMEIYNGIGRFPYDSRAFLSKMPVMLRVNSGFCFAKQWNSECC